MAAIGGSEEGSMPIYYIRAEDLGVMVNPEYAKLDLAEVKEESELEETCAVDVDNTSATSPLTQEDGTPIILQFIDTMPISIINRWNSTPSLVQSGQETKKVRRNPAAGKIRFLGCSEDGTTPAKEGHVKCNECSVQFKSQKVLNAHMQLHKIRKCGICNVTFETPVELHDHLEIHMKGVLQTNQQSVAVMVGSNDAPIPIKKECSNATPPSIDELPVKCSKCPAKFNSRDTLMVHMQLHNDVESGKDDVKFQTPDKLQEHLKSQPQADVQPIACSEGDAIPAEEERSDVASTTIDGFPVKCGACPARFRSEQLLNAHMEFHKKSNCSVCEANFVTSADLQDHLKSHMKILFRANQQLLNSCRSASIPLHQGPSEKLPLIGRFKLKCGICNARFKSQESVEAHIQLHETSKCSVCHDSFETPAELHAHLKIHVKTLFQTNQQLLSSYEGASRPKGKCVAVEPTSKKIEVPQVNLEPSDVTVAASQFPFECSKCPARFGLQKSLDAHVLLHQSHKCSVCKARFLTIAALNEHLKTHPNEMSVEGNEGEPTSTEQGRSDAASVLTEPHSFKCSKCSAGFVTQRGLNAHMQVHPVHGTCGVCGTGFKSPTSLLEHLQIHLQGLPLPKKQLFNSGESVPEPAEERRDDAEHAVVSEVPFECQNCSARFGSQRSLSAHMGLHKSRECSVCSLRFETVVKRQEHMKIHLETNHETTTEPTTSKPKLPQVETRSADTLSTLSTSTTRPSFECNTCSARFKSQPSLNAHKQLHTSRECGLCWERFDTPAELHHHLRKHMRGQAMLMSAVHLHPCPYCEFVFTTGRRLFFHLKEHPEKSTYDCSKCHMAFFTVEEFAEHKMSHGLISCNLCDAKFRIRSELDAHNQLHDFEKPFACTLCIKRYTSKNELTRHLRTHSKDKPFSCSFCPAKFRQPSAVKEHEMLHKNEKKLGCAHCPARFYRKTALKYHLRVHSYLEFSKEKMVEEILAKPHHCASCFARFASQTSLRRHERNKSCDKPQSVRNRRPPPVEQVSSI